MTFAWTPAAFREARDPSSAPCSRRGHEGHVTRCFPPGFYVRSLARGRVAPPRLLAVFLLSWWRLGPGGEGLADIIPKARESPGRGAAGPRLGTETHTRCSEVPSQRGLNRGGGASRFHSVLLRTGRTPRTRPCCHTRASPGACNATLGCVAGALPWALLASTFPRGKDVFIPCSSPPVAWVHTFI